MALRQTTLRFQLNKTVLKSVYKYQFTRMSASANAAPVAGSNSQSTSPPPPIQQQARSRPSQGDLVEHVMSTPDYSNYPLIDIAINLTDRSFDKVRHIKTSPLPPQKTKNIDGGSCIKYILTSSILILF